MTTTENKIRFGIVGTGNITSWFLTGAALDRRFSATALYSRTHDSGTQFAKKHDIPQVYTSLEQMVLSPDVDAVYIASPNSLHAEQAILCMEHGKHVLCEKPLAANATEARMMIAKAKENGVVLMEAMIATLNPNFKTAIENISSLGIIRRYFSSYCQYSSRYDAYKAGALPNVFNPSFAGGGAMDLGIYAVYPMVVLFGKPLSVTASGILLPSGVDAQGTISCRYRDMEATLLYSKIANSYLPTEIEGEDGNMILADIHNLKSVTFIPRPQASSGRDSRYTREELGNADIPDLYYCETKEFIDTINSGRTESSVNSHNNSLITIEILDEVRRQIGVTF